MTYLVTVLDAYTGEPTRVIVESQEELVELLQLLNETNVLTLDSAKVIGNYYRAEEYIAKLKESIEEPKDD